MPAEGILAPSAVWSIKSFGFAIINGHKGWITLTLAFKSRAGFAQIIRRSNNPQRLKLP